MSAGLNDTLNSTGRFNVSQSMAHMARRSGMPAGGLASTAVVAANDSTAGINKQVRSRQRFGAAALFLPCASALTVSGRAHCPTASLCVVR
eukprot:COSAG02_NODE_6486_length_3542_cov_12.720681_2_plen_91_part_00